MDGPAFRPYERAQIEHTIYARFAEQVAQFPQRPAVWSPRFQWTYEALSARVDATARALLDRLGDGPGRVALAFDHDAPVIAGILATMRAGKTYVPLDPGYPEQRLRMMLQDSSAEAILIEAQHQDLASCLCGGDLPIVVEGTACSTSGTTFPSRHPRDTAYILYTSGSTGRPKGVVQNHRNVLHFIRAYTNGLQISPTDRMTLLSSYSFDAAVMGIFGSILNGACVCPFSVRECGFGELAAWIRRDRITIYHSTPTVFREFLGVSSSDERFSTVRRVVLGGEPVVRRDVERFRQFFDPGTILVNGLGPTESTVTLQNFIDHSTEVTGNLVPVGRPVCDTSIILRDEQGHETDREGEMIFVSEHVALEYWRRPELNEISFGDVADAPGLRWYRSGDLARWRDDGTLEFLGRKDSQIKIHGVRIELGDIEAALQQQTGVLEAVAIGKTSPGSELPRLVAYVRRVPGAEMDDSRHAEQIRAGVRTLLPSTMVPNIVVFLDAFPKTPTGKIDRLALPEPGEMKGPARPSGDEPLAAPANDVEERLVRLWQDMLGIDKVYVTDTFNSLGGDSLTALRVLFRMKALGVSHDAARGILQGKTIREIARPGEEIQVSATPTSELRMTLVVNIVRGLLLALVIAGHWLPTVVHRMPSLAPWQQPLNVIFNISTPGFAFIFGLTMGKIYYPKYRLNVEQTRRTFHIATLILLSSLFIELILSLAAGDELRMALGWLFLFVWTYYALAFATALSWFNFMSRFSSEYVGCAVLMAAFYSFYIGLSLWLGPYDDVGGPILVGLLIGKFNYLNMSFGVIGGCALGIYLWRHAGEDPHVLSLKATGLGVVCILLGLCFLGIRSGSFDIMGDDRADMGLWRWCFYSGMVLVFSGSLTAAAARLEMWPSVLRQGAEIVATFGQCTFPIFLVHIIVWRLKPVLNGLHVPDLVGFAVLLTIFIGFSSWMVGSLYRLHYAGPLHAT